MQNNDYDRQERELYEQLNNDVAKAAAALQKAKELASDSTRTFDFDINSSIAYYVNLSDLHIPEGNMYALVEKLKDLAKIPNLYFSLGGDQINNSVVNSVGDTHTEVLNGQEQVKLLASIIKEVDKETPIIDKILAILAGNHENRSEKETSLNPAYLLAVELGIQHRYVKNTAIVKINLNNDLDPGKKITTVMKISHGESLPGKATSQAEVGLASQVDPGVDVVVVAHNHKVTIASEKKLVHSLKRSTPKTRDVTFVNFGSVIAGGEYADRANYPYPRVADGEILRLVNVNGNKKQDFINIRGLISNSQKERLTKVAKAFKALQNKTYGTESEIEKTYQLVSNKLYHHIMKEDKQEKQDTAAVKKRTSMANRIFLAPLSGFRVGDAELKNENEIEEKINILSKLNGSCKIILNGDMLFYKKAITIGQGKQGEKFVEDTYSYIQELAKMLEPVKDKIIGINYGQQETKIMQYQEEELAEYALSNNQMDESLVYMPYNKQELLRAQNKIQRRRVELYKKANLHNELNKFYLNSKPLDVKLKVLLAATTENYKLLSEEQKQQLLTNNINKYQSFENDHSYDVGIDNKKSKNGQIKEEKLKSKEDKQRDYIEKLLVTKLRKNGKILSLSKNKKQIARLFPLESIKAKKPHKNLLAHMLCDFLEIDPKNININKINENNFRTLKIKDDTNKTRTISLYGSSSSSKAGRSSIENNLRAKHKVAPGANIYFTNTVSGKEFVVLDTTMISDETGQKNQIDTYYISAGTFDGISSNKIYKFYASANPKKPMEESKGIYYNANKDFNLYCESLNYETALLEEDILQSVIVNMAKTSLRKTLTAYQEKQQQQKLDKKLDSFANKVIKKPVKKANNTKTNSNEIIL
jgi:hypothetical protein